MTYARLRRLGKDEVWSADTTKTHWKADDTAPVANTAPVEDNTAPKVETAPATNTAPAASNPEVGATTSGSIITTTKTNKELRKSVILFGLTGGIIGFIFDHALVGLLVGGAFGYLADHKFVEVKNMLPTQVNTVLENTTAKLQEEARKLDEKLTLVKPTIVPPQNAQ